MTSCLKVLLRLPDGSAAAEVPVEIQALETEPVEVITDQEGAALHIFTPTASHAQIVVKVSSSSKGSFYTTVLSE